MLPDIPIGWQTVLAAAGAILVVVMILRWTGAILAGHGKISELLINRSYDLVDKMVPEVVEPEPPSSPDLGSEEPGLATSSPPPPPLDESPPLTSGQT